MYALVQRIPGAIDRMIVRKINEELAIPYKELESVKLIGCAREFERLGKPEFFYYVKSKWNSDKIKSSAKLAVDAWELKGTTGANFIAGSYDLIELLMTKAFNPISRAGLFFLAAYFMKKEDRPGPFGVGGQDWM